MAFGSKPYPVPDPEEVATIDVDGARYDDWETVYVQLRWQDWYPVFQFSAAERDPNPPLWERIQFAPPDPVAIYLGGQLAITGNITRRQTAYDKGNHAVQLFGVGRTFWAGRASIIPTQDFSGQTLFQVAQSLVKKRFGIDVIQIGDVDQTPFKTLQNEPGQTVFDFIERIARPRGAVFAPDHLGNFLLIGQHSWQPVWDLVEGQNILRMQAMYSIENTYLDVRTQGQSGGDDQQNMSKSSELEGNSSGFSKMPYSPIMIPSEQPVWSKGELMARAHAEDRFTSGTYLTADVTVQGWLRGGIALWMPGDKVTVTSPMAMMNGTEMKIQSATFTQDRESGTLTQLHLVAPWLLNDSMNADPTGIMPAAPDKNPPTPADPPTPQVQASPPETLTPS